MSTTFKEEGSGLMMDPALYYVLSDSGSAYLPTGYPTPDEAKAATLAKWPDVEVITPTFVSDKEGWDDMGEANVLLGANLRDFWIANPI